jgi:hypothetical protein
MSEKSFSKEVKKKLEKKGFFILDLEALGDGIPDCAIIDFMNNKCVFLEFKHKGNSLTIHQRAWMKKNPKANILILEKTSLLKYNLFYNRVTMGAYEQYQIKIDDVICFLKSMLI